MTFVHTPPKYVVLWMLVSSIVVLWDAGYIFFRPYSMPGGSLHFLWAPYSIYAKVDYVYGFPAFHEGDGFPAAQSFLNLIESALNLTYVYLWYTSSGGEAHITAVILGLVSAVMTESKTILYSANEVFSGWKNVGHNDWFTLAVFYFLPNWLWIIFPALIIRGLWKDIAASLRTSTGTAKKAA